MHLTSTTTHRKKEQKKERYDEGRRRVGGIEYRDKRTQVRKKKVKNEKKKKVVADLYLDVQRDNKNRKPTDSGGV